MEPKNLYLLTASAALSLFKNSNVTVEEYARSLLRRIEARDGVVKAWEFISPDLVINEARALDRVPKDQRKPLHGVAVAIKDVIETKNMPTRFGSPLYQQNRPGSDAATVAILRSAGALIIGKTTTTEFTMINSGPETANPLDPARTPGGSSAGSAAAVADFQVPLSVGTQTGGSIIRPAAYTGIFSMKPTWNSISPEGQKTCSWSFDTFGFFARSIEDLQLMADVFGLVGSNPPKSVAIEGARIAFVKSPLWHRAGPGTVSAMERAAKVLESKGAVVDQISFPAQYDDHDSLKHMMKVCSSGEARVTFLKEYEMDKSLLHPEIRSIVENSLNITAAEFVNAQNKYAEMRPVFDELAAKYTAIITPSAVDEAPLGLDDMGSAVFNTFWSGVHMPVINVPAFVGAHGMPVGLSIVTSRFQEQHLLKTSKLISDILIAEGGWVLREPKDQWCAVPLPVL